MTQPVLNATFFESPEGQDWAYHGFATKPGRAQHNKKCVGVTICYKLKKAGVAAGLARNPASHPAAAAETTTKAFLAPV